MPRYTLAAGGELGAFILNLFDVDVRDAPGAATIEKLRELSSVCAITLRRTLNTFCTKGDKDGQSRMSAQLRHFLSTYGAADEAAKELLEVGNVRLGAVERSRFYVRATNDCGYVTVLLYKVNVKQTSGDAHPERECAAAFFSVAPEILRKEVCKVLRAAPSARQVEALAAVGCMPGVKLAKLVISYEDRNCDGPLFFDTETVTEREMLRKEISKDLEGVLDVVQKRRLEGIPLSEVVDETLEKILDIVVQRANLQ